MFGNVKTMTCNQVYASAAAAGALTTMNLPMVGKLEDALGGRGLPPMVHHALAGLVVHQVCAGQFGLNQNAAAAAMSGWGGAFAYRYFYPK